MTIAAKLSQYLRDHSVDYKLIRHPYTRTTRESARAAHLLDEQVAKAVLLKDDQGYVLAVLPASNNLDLHAVHEETGRNHLELVPEEELERAFPDCKLGALPPLGQAYGLTTLLDNRLRHCDTVYFEAGDHEELVEMDGAHFVKLFSGCRNCDLSKEWV